MLWTSNPKLSPITFYIHEPWKTTTKSVKTSLHFFHKTRVYGHQEMCQLCYIFSVTELWKNRKHFCTIEQVVSTVVQTSDMVLIDMMK